MIKQLHKRKATARDGGFTIIEVMIVLAIAGLILLIVFLAVPALQRNSRNTQRKTDVSAILGAVQEYVDNNGGSLPGGVNVDTASSQVLFCASGTCTTSNSTPARLGFYNTATNSVQFATSTPTLSSTNDIVYVMKGFTCNGNAPTAGSPRSVVAYFAVEPNAAAQCQGS